MTTDTSSPPASDPLQGTPRPIEGWSQRHQLPFNFWIHMADIPLAYGGLVLLFFLPWYCGIGTSVFGFFLQWVGHRAEGNDVGEWAAIKRMLGLPYVGVAPRWEKGEHEQMKDGR